ncbi:MAG: hypothetical protein QOE93_39, partial [Actinomycetota bacterium]|nr:hypothetical protein [Actinomycetota bacterium]
MTDAPAAGPGPAPGPALEVRGLAF